MALSQSDVNSFIVRTNGRSLEVVLLFELIVTISSMIDGKEAFSNRSAGWATLSLHAENGDMIEARVHELQLSGGSPADQVHVPLAPAPSLSSRTRRKTASSIWQRIIEGDTSARLNIRVWKPNSSLMDKVDKLPMNLLCWVSSIRVLAMIRDLLFHQLYPETSSPTTTANPSISTRPQMEPSYAPDICIALRLINSPDLLLELCSLWDAKRRLLSRTDKKSFSVLKHHFFQALIELWPVITASDLPPLVQGDLNKVTTRSLLISQARIAGPEKCFRQEAGQMAFLAFDSEECMFDVLKSHIY